MRELTPAIKKLLEDRYYLRDNKGNLIEHSIEEVFKRVAHTVAKAEKEGERAYWEEMFYNLLEANKFLPNTPLLAGAGTDTNYAACFCIDINDSLDNIFETLKKAAIIFKNGGGLGINLSPLREKGAVIKTSGFTSSGPISFMKVFNSMCDAVTQGGRRKGGILGGFNVDHPDIEKFIACKDNTDELTNFNISVIITDKFMEAVEHDLRWELISPVTNTVTKTIPARDLWNQIVEHAWRTGEPGLIFIDTVNNAHPYKDKQAHWIKCMNLCSEVNLESNQSCILGSINLMSYLDNDDFRWDELNNDVSIMVRFLDNIIDVNNYPLPEIETATKRARKIGLGIMGWADALIKMQIPYDSEAALDKAKELMQFISKASLEVSSLLAMEKGNFPDWEQSTYDIPMRNAMRTTIAPTGSISRIAGCSSGLEPIFSWKTHHKLVNLEYDEVHWAYKEWIEKYDNTPLPRYMKTAGEIAPEWHIKMQAIFQNNGIDHSISKSINLPNSAAPEDIDSIFRMAYKSKIKSITIYRDGSRTDQPLTKIEDSMPKEPQTTIEASTYRKRGPVAIGATHKIDTGNGKMYITINYSGYQPEPVEVFIRLGHLATATESALAEWAGRLLSLLLKYNVPIESIQRQSNKVYSDVIFWYDQRSFYSLPKLMSYLLGLSLEESMCKPEQISDALSIAEPDKKIYGGSYCYNCGNYTMINEGGCQTCTNCGYERCGG